MNSQSLLSILVAGASLIGAFFYGHAQKSSPRTETSDVSTINRVKSLQAEVDQLRQENITLRELAESSNSDFIIPKEWIEFVEEANGFSFQQAPTVIRGIEDEFLKSAATAWITYFSEAGMIDRQYALSAIGMIPEGNIAIQLALAETGPGLRRAMYDYERGCIIIAFDFDEKNIFDQTTLTQALSIALVEQNFPIPAPLTDDAWLARRMVIHGNAIAIRQLHMTKLQQRFQLNGAEIKPPVSAEAIRNAQLDFQELPRYVRETIKAHAMWGRSFVEAQSGETRAKQLTQALIKAQTTLAVMTTKNIASPIIQSDKKLILHTSLGAMAIYIHAANGKTIADPLTLSKDWVSDELQFHQTEDDKLEVRWHIKFSSKQASTAFLEHLKDIDETLTITEQDGMVKLCSSKPLL